ncbi:MAG: hypothetical protein NBV67_16150 [Tagaea sp.]|nr:hypothetical protein [Tagaea sp.]
MASASPLPVCTWCHRSTRPIWVHGHMQCEHCKINIAPCCDGDECSVPEARAERVAAP